MRLDGKTYQHIADALGLSLNTIKTHCTRNNLTKAAISAAKSCCRYCGKPLGGSQKKFCSDSCRFTWWNKNREYSRDSKAVVARICAHCGKTYVDYENKQRKYCGHDCYVQARFGKAASA